MSGLALRVVIDGVSPLIVRTLAVPSGLSLSALNRVLLACFGWSGECLHEFEIRARRYCGEWIVDAAAKRSTFTPLAVLLPDRSTPELGLVEAKLGAHMSYRAAGELLGELFPTGRRVTETRSPAPSQ